MLKRFACLFFVLVFLIAACKKKVIVENGAKEIGSGSGRRFVVEPRFESENVEVPGSLLPVEKRKSAPK